MTDKLNFGQALEAIKTGSKIARIGWNGKNMWLALIKANDYDISPETSIIPGGTTLLPWIGMKTATGEFVPWLASQTDILADDWCILIS